jgi:FkbM family methyltransferase
MILSYAQNMEDVVLAQVFASDAMTANGGTYIDIGGGHAVADNVTFALYLQGWRGVVVEPQVKLAAPYATIRPRDVVVSALVGRVVGEAAFHEVDKLHGFSTMVEANAAQAAGFGTSYATKTLPMTTLAALCEAHHLTRIDLLKIDVEGAEADVLAGNEWQRFRPRVLCVEAVAPGTMADNWAGWEPQLLAEGYQFAYFDGLNRFYVAAECAALATRFPQSRTDWGAAAHLYDFGKPLYGDKLGSAKHADHALATALAEGFLALLPVLDSVVVTACLTAGLGDRKLTPEALKALMLGNARLLDPVAQTMPALREDQATNIAALMQTDAFRAALGRIACFHDGGHLIED